MKTLKILLIPAVLLAAASMAFAGSPYGYSNSYGHSSYGYNHSYSPSYSSYTPSYHNSYNSYNGYSTFDNYSYGSQYYNNYNYNNSYHSLSYSNWTYDQSHGYYYCTCSYRPSAYAEWNKYICIYNSQYGNCVYFYNPIQKNYWGRYDYNAKGFSLLAAGYQRGAIADLPQDKFPAVVAQTTIPGSQVAEQLTSPPALPSDAVAALPAK